MRRGFPLFQRTLFLNEGAGRKKTPALFCFVFFTQASRGNSVCGLRRQSTTIGPCLWSEVCGSVCTQSHVAVKLQGGDQVKNKAFWQPCQLPAYFPGDVTTDVGLYPWAPAFGPIPPTTYAYACALLEYTSIFKPRWDKTCWVSYGDWFKLPWCKVHKQVTSETAAEALGNKMGIPFSLEAENSLARKRKHGELIRGSEFPRRLQNTSLSLHS